jgi:hypothetical protein
VCVGGKEECVAWCGCVHQWGLLLLVPRCPPCFSDQPAPKLAFSLSPDRLLMHTCTPAA